MYFAYGSNLTSARMCARVPSARFVGVARLSGWRLTLDKRGADGSGKANLAPDARAQVWGAAYRLDANEWSGLDAHEPGYERREIQILLGKRVQTAWTYVSGLRTRDPVAHEWYKRLIVDGARDHGLPEDWIRWLAALPARPAREP